MNYTEWSLVMKVNL
jgi:hypothetical protein